ncbi:MAG TPA: MBL fold metallo-hydrolase [Chloroflexota bacterium]|nr:MBL fold metallo-hydrolase [Chloroflexota bacterium]
MSAFRDEGRNVATGRPVAVLPGIYELRESLAPAFATPDCWVSLWLLLDPQRWAPGPTPSQPQGATAEGAPLAIVDSGVPRSTETVILPALQALGRRPQDLAVVVNTHSHHDHAGSNVQLRQATGCQIWIHRDDAPALERGSHFGAEPCLPHRADRLLEEGERLHLGGREYEVLHLPGHSPGSIGLYDRRRRLLFCGDALQAQGTATQGIAGASDREAYYGTLDKVEALEVDHLLAAHPYLPFTDSHVQPRPEVKRYLAECRRFFDEIDDEILTALRAGATQRDDGASTDELAARICAGRGFGGTCALTAAILRGYLTRLERAGRVRRLGEGAATRWSAVPGA